MPTDSTVHVPDPDAMAQPLGDPLGELLHLMSLTGTFYCQSRLSAPWAIAVPAFGGVMSFALVTCGQCWLSLPGRDPVQLQRGSLALLTGENAHHLSSAPDVPAVGLDDLPIRRITEVYETLEHGGGGAACHVLYGIVRLDRAASGLLMSLLPDLLVIDTWAEETGNWLQATLQVIATEASSLRPGGEAIITKLADVVVIEAIRRWLNSDAGAETGWLKGVRDPRIGRVIRAVHGTPGEDWDVVRMARVAGMSRSAFSARFSDLVGMSAARYVTVWRMHLARERLTRSAQPQATIAADLGYCSEPAFHRAYRRVFGEAPGEVRRRSTAGPV